MKKYEHFQLPGTFYGGKLESPRLVDNLIPGPGTYDPDPKHPMPSYRIKDKQNFSRNREKDLERKIVGPSDYSPKWPHELSPSKPGISFGNSVRKEDSATNKSNPAPNTYQLLGDFDFRDPSRPAGDILSYKGKTPKFHFGIKFDIKNKSLDFPGPAEYNTDQHPMNQKDLAYWIGTDVRRDMSIPYSHMYPGPGSYNHTEPNSGAHIS